MIIRLKWDFEKFYIFLEQRVTGLRNQLGQQDHSALLGFESIYTTGAVNHLP